MSHIPRCGASSQTPKAAAEVEANILPRPGKGSKPTAQSPSTRANLHHFLSAFTCQGGGSQKFWRTGLHHCSLPHNRSPPRISTKDLLHSSPCLSQKYSLQALHGDLLSRDRQNTNSASSREPGYIHTYLYMQTHQLFSYGKNTHNIKLNILTFSVALVAQCCATITTTHFKSFFIIPNRDSIPIK